MAEPRMSRAAQYLRMSTDHQRYSLAAQAEAIAAYAAANRYDVNCTYFDPGESGLGFETRRGLQALLLAALDEHRAFDAILVLDVSRWGRFQDIDQPAHYEYLCRSAGVRVIYCAEPFDDNGSPVASLLKTLKRIMAAEFSRELSVKAHAARVQQARLGFFQGGAAAYGVRRVLVDAAGRPRAQLARGERKALVGERVILQPGPPEELAVVRHIFRRYVRDGRGQTSIAAELNAQGIPSVTGGGWRSANVDSVLRNELAIGIYVTNSRTQALKTTVKPRPPGEWVRTRVFSPIVPASLFRKAQARLGRGERERPLEQPMLKALRMLLEVEGRLNARIINRSRDTHGAQTYRKYFGSLNRAYELIGYVPTRWKGPTTPLRLEALLERLRLAHQRHGYLCATLIAGDPDVPAVETYQKHFGSLRRAYELAGLPHAQTDLIRAAHGRARLRRTAAAVPGSRLGSCSPCSNEQLLDVLRETFVRHGAVSHGILAAGPGARPSVYAARFGSLTRAYVLAGLPDEFLRGSWIRRFTEPHRPPGQQRASADGGGL